VGNDTVYSDIVCLNKQAQDNLKTHVQDKLPVQYQKCIGWIAIGVKKAGISLIVIPLLQQITAGFGLN
jgi:hypothetical protein